MVGLESFRFANLTLEDFFQQKNMKQFLSFD